MTMDKRCANIVGMSGGAAPEQKDGTAVCSPFGLVGSEYLCH